MGRACLALLADGDGAAGAGVQRHLVRDADVDAFDDVDLAACGPVGADDPAGGVLGIAVRYKWSCLWT